MIFYQILFFWKNPTNHLQFHSFCIMDVFHQFSCIQLAICLVFFFFFILAFFFFPWLVLHSWTLHFWQHTRGVWPRSHFGFEVWIKDMKLVYLKTEYFKECIRCCRQHAGTPRRLQCIVPPDEIPGRSLFTYATDIHTSFLVPYDIN